MVALIFGLYGLIAASSFHAAERPSHVARFECSYRSELYDEMRRNLITFDGWDFGDAVSIEWLNEGRVVGETNADGGPLYFRPDGTFSTGFAWGGGVFRLRQIQRGSGSFRYQGSHHLPHANVREEGTCTAALLTVPTPASTGSGR